MDGNQRMKQNERSMSRSGNAARRAPGRATDRFDPAMQPRGDQTGMSQPPEQPPMSYDYGYTGSSFHGGSLQSNDLQSYQPQEFVRSQRPQAPSIQHQRRRAPQDPAAFSPYESSMLYGFGQQGPTQGHFEVVPQYQTRQSAAIDVLSNQFVPQYFSEESAGSGLADLSPFLNAQLQRYNQPGPMPRPTTTQSFPAPVSDFAVGSGSMNRLDQPQTESQEQSDQPSLEEAIGRYQRILRRTFDQTRAGRLVEAGGSLLEISEWLVTNARDLGLLHDDSIQYNDRLKLWSEFNLCWLAICQKQKDLVMEMIATSQQPVHTSLIPRDRMDAMGRDLIQLCDQLEPHGLVDYQMGVWEEEILSGEFALYSNYTYSTSHSYQIQSWVNALISWTVDPTFTTSLPDPKPRQYHDHESSPKEETEEQKNRKQTKTAKKIQILSHQIGSTPKYERHDR
ncbi:uncharacterized protein PGRI_068240 [Penicillium griseofulvum]|uniref:Uncharacterized protein n=1 Tax=Penicillium patulum TaxID=5078 RepID=A0A135LMZ4_PENPA|nr:uncharacterized protein PGRI_068240 [Penicillium griseofulvum]KXG50333.1 hypothetical protein PGRI_068240 [Penicillium griseofulvum]